MCTQKSHAVWLPLIAQDMGLCLGRTKCNASLYFPQLAPSSPLYTTPAHSVHNWAPGCALLFFLHILHPLAPSCRNGPISALNFEIFFIH